MLLDKFIVGKWKWSVLFIVITLCIIILQLSYPVQIGWVLPHDTGLWRNNLLDVINSRGVNSAHHCHYTMALADSKFSNFFFFFCSAFNWNNKNVNTLIAWINYRDLLVHYQRTRNFQYRTWQSLMRYWNFLFIVSELLQVNPDNWLAECVNL